MGVPERRLEAVGRELDRQAERVLEVDRVHEAAVLDAAVLDPALVEPLHRLVEDGLRERERDVVHAARVGRRAARVGRALLVREDGDQASVARVEVEVALGRSLSRFGCSNTNGMPSTPSQKSIDVCRSAPTRVMWWTPWL